MMRIVRKPNQELPLRAFDDADHRGKPILIVYRFKSHWDFLVPYKIESYTVFDSSIYPTINEKWSLYSLRGKCLMSVDGVIPTFNTLKQLLDKYAVREQSDIYIFSDLGEMAQYIADNSNNKGV